MGYIIVLVLGGVVLVAILFAVMSAKRRPSGQARPANDVTPKAPAAETLNPAASNTADQRQVDAAQRRTPPA